MLWYYRTLLYNFYLVLFDLLSSFLHKYLSVLVYAQKCVFTPICHTGSFHESLLYRAHFCHQPSLYVFYFFYLLSFSLVLLLEISLTTPMLFFCIIIYLCVYMWHMCCDVTKVLLVFINVHMDFSHIIKFIQHIYI